MWRFIFLLSFLPSIALAQDEIAEVDTAKEEAKILIIPFEEKLFYCDIMRDLTEKNNLSAQQIYTRFRNEIQHSLKMALKDSMATASFLNSDSITDEHLVDIYSVLGYKFIPIPVKEEVDKNGKPKKVKKKAEPKKEVGIRNGQVVAERQVTERYMNAFLKDNSILNNLDSVYGLNRFLFINQMDVKMDLSDPETAFIDPRRVVAIHYTILNKEGKQVSGGLASAQFPGTESNMNHIIGGCLYKLSAEVMKSLMIAEKRAEEESEKELNRQSKTKQKKSGKDD